MSSFELNIWHNSHLVHDNYLLIGFCIFKHMLKYFLSSGFFIRSSSDLVSILVLPMQRAFTLPLHLKHYFIQKLADLNTLNCLTFVGRWLAVDLC